MVSRIRARLVERFIFNFRAEVGDVACQFPPWLTPQLVNSSAVGSFCTLDLDRVTFEPMPDMLGLRNINCALRFGALEKATGIPCVYVVERNTNSKVGAFITSLGFPGEHKLVDASIVRDQDAWKISVGDGEKESISAVVSEGTRLQSGLFETMDSFEAFLANGVRSYCPARREGQYNVVDLHKDESKFEPLQVEHLTHDIFSHPVQFDSAVRTAGGRYIWEYIGQREG